MATMHDAPVDAAGTTLGYIDSGPPPGDSYTTIVLVHGHSYTAQVFSRLLPLASSHNLRIVAPNRRDYVNSTPLSTSELHLLFSHNDADHKQYLRERGLEIAWFLAWVINELKIPPAEPENMGGSKGGLVLAGWSLGSVTTLAFLRYLPSFPAELVETLKPYLKTFIIYESAYATLGYPHPQGTYHPLRDASIPAHERSAAFSAWVSSYFTHPFYASASAPSNEPHTLDQLTFHTPGLERTSDLGYPIKSGGNSAASALQLPSNANIEPEAFAMTVDSSPGERSEVAFYGTVRAETLYDQLSGALHLSSSDSLSPSVSAASKESEVPAQEEIVLPDLRAVYIFGTRSHWGVQWGAWALKSDISSHPEGTRRPMELVRVEGTNHFWHWDEPDAFLALLAEKCGSQNLSSG